MSSSSRNGPIVHRSPCLRQELSRRLSRLADVVMMADDRAQRGSTTISSRRVDRQEDCLFGRTVIGRGNILDLKLNAQHGKGMLKFKSNERDSTTSNARIFLSLVLT